MATKFAPISLTPGRPKVRALPYHAEAGRTMPVQEERVRINILRPAEVESSPGPKPRIPLSCRSCHTA